MSVDTFVRHVPTSIYNALKIWKVMVCNQNKLAFHKAESMAVSFRTKSRSKFTD